MSEAGSEGVRTPQPVMGFYDVPMWQTIAHGAMALQRCDDCGRFQYPPGPVCSHCLSPRLTWRPLSGRGTILSWVIFHKGYLAAYPAPYNVIAVRLDEDVVLVSNLEAPLPEGDWIGRQVRMTYTTMADGFVLPRFVLAS